MNNDPPRTVSCVARGLLVWLGFFAGWSGVSVLLTLGGAPFWTLGFAFLGGVVGALWGWRLRGCLSGSLGGPHVSGVALWEGESIKSYWLAGLCGLCFAVGAAYFVKSSNATPLWCVTLLIAVASLWFSPKGVGALGDEVRKASEAHVLLGFVSLTLVIVGLYLVVHRPDADDAFYLNLPLGIQTTSDGMMVWDTMYGVERWPLLGSNYRVEALPTLVAGCSWLTGLSVLSVAHVVLPIVWCVAYAGTLLVIGYVFLGRHWWLFAVLALLTLLGFGGSLQTWGVHGVFRFFHGKGPLLNVVGPLILMVVIQSQRSRLGLVPALILLTGLEVVALGLTANSIYLAPLTLGLMLLPGCLLRGREGFRSLVLLCSAWPPLAAGVYLLLFDRPVPVVHESAVGRDLGLWDMANSKYLLGVFLAVVLASALGGMLSQRGKWATFYLLGGLVFVFNPFLWSIYGAHVTGGLNFRLFWAVPLPIFAGLLLTWLMVGRGKVVVVCVLAIGVGLAVGPQSIFRTEGTRLGLSLQKVPRASFEAASEANAMAPEGRLVLAPEEVATWMGVTEGHASSVYVRRLYLDQSVGLVEPEQIDGRVLLGEWVNGGRELALEEVVEAMGVLNVGLVVRSILEEVSPGDFGVVMELVGGRLVKTVDGFEYYEISASRP